MRKLAAICITSFFSLGGCQQDRSLAPPPDSETITVTVKLPEELKTETMWVMYRSTTCRSVTHGASGQRLERDGHHSVYREFQRQGQSDLYQVELPKDGGGACRWHLANVTFGVQFVDPTRFGENAVNGAGGGVIVIFDHNNSPQGGADIEVEGDLSVRKEYYPWVDEEFLGRYKKRVSLNGESRIYSKYKATQAKRVYFEPVVYADFVIHSAGPKVKKKGNYTTFIYPDGSVAADGKWHPKFLRLQAIRTGRAEDCFAIWRYRNCPDRRPQLLPEWLPEPDKPGYGRYLIVDEWGNGLPAYVYWLIGQDGRILQGKTDPNGHTQPLPITAHPPRAVEFPVDKW